MGYDGYTHVRMVNITVQCAYKHNPCCAQQGAHNSANANYKLLQQCTPAHQCLPHVQVQNLQVL